MTTPLQISVGDQFTKWTVIANPKRTTPSGQQVLTCQCQCGFIRDIAAKDLKNGKSKGCLYCRTPTIKHGHNRIGNISPTYESWRAMIDRCENPKSPSWKSYGAKGVTVYDQWHKFENFLADMGERPNKDFTLDRINPALNYYPENCRWLPSVLQNRNRRTNRLVTFQGQTHPIVTWSEITGIDANRIRARLNLGWSVEDALTTSVRAHKPYRNLIHTLPED